MAGNSYTHDNASAPGIALAHTIYGEPVTASMRPEMAVEGTVRQVQSVFTDYKPPKRRLKDNPSKALCSEDGCNAFPVDGKNYCPGHARAHGEMKLCAHRDCKGAPKNGTDYCRWHGPTPAVTDESD
jgi:hypothetical protein